MKDVGQKMAKGAAWMVFFKLTERSIGLISTIILARLLIPEDFGVIAMAMSIIAILELLGAFGFDVAIIQNQTAERKHYDTAWTYNVLFAIASTLILALLASPAALFYNEPRLENVIYFLALGNLIRGFENIGILEFRKNMTFEKEFKFQLGKKLAGFFTTVPLAIFLGSYWVLVVGMLMGWFVGVILSFMLHPYRPRFSLLASHELFHFSKWLLITNIFNFVKIRSADFIIGRLSGTQALGLFTISYEISNLPTTELVAPINRAVFPGYAKISNNMAALREGFLKVLAMIAIFSLPAGLGIAAISEPLVLVFLGPKWIDTIPLIHILAIFGATLALQTNTGSVFLALGKPKILAIIGFIHIVLLVPTLMVLVNVNGTIGAAWGYLAVTVLMLPINFGFIMGYTKLKLLPIVSVLWRPLMATAIMYFVVTMILDFLGHSDKFIINLGYLLFTVATGAVIYTTSMLVLWRLSGSPQGAEKDLLDTLKARLKVKGER